MAMFVLSFAVICLLVVCVYLDREISDLERRVKDTERRTYKDAEKLAAETRELLAKHTNLENLFFSNVGQVDKLKEKVDYLDLKTRNGQTLTVHVPDIIKVAHRQVNRKIRPLLPKDNQ